ncbi:MAG: SUMF1/EgtB/PvdO family nonheme iron enzyme [Verrucomicrobia bacterium]|nr:SUMF1/EgtB/PvdO family nonheme iron enzyme [Verrucomicrobiota bacterium]
MDFDQPCCRASSRRLVLILAGMFWACGGLFTASGMAADAREETLRECQTVMRQCQDVNLEAARLAIDDMARSFPERYAAATHRQALEEFIRQRPALLQALGEGRANALPSARQVLAGVRAALLSNPLLECDRLLYLKRQFPAPQQARQAMGEALGVGSLNAHTSDTIPRQGPWNDQLAVLSRLRGEPASATLYQAENRESLIDPVLHFDAGRLLFAKRGARQGNWRVFEIGVDGSGLRQVTPDDGEDVGHFDPCYLPDGRVMFASTAVYQGLPCEFGGRQMVCLYLLDPATGRIRQLTFEQDSDWCPTVLPNGRVLYQRWEYTDQSHANSRMLFHMNPDGTDQREFRGSGSWFPASFFYAKPVPGEVHQVIGVAGGHHGTPRSGRLLIFDPSQGRRDGEGIVQEIPGRGKPVEPVVRDRLVDGVWPQFLMPWPLSGKYHLTAAKLRPDSLWGIYLVDVFDNLTLIQEVEGAALLWPILLKKRVTPPAIPDRVDLRSDQATVFITDLYSGPGLKDVPRGTVKKLRVIEYYFSRRGFGGLYGTLGMDGPWDVKRILGTVPVEDDGSAYFSIPANTPLSIQPVDDRGQALQLMRSWMVGMPGEALSCAGCHEPQHQASSNKPARAARRGVSAIQPWHGPARGFSFVREVQPVLDRHCLGCHDAAKPGQPSLKGGAMLTDWSTQLAGQWTGGGKFTKSYFELQRFVRRPGIEGDRRMFTPLDYHFSTTELGQMLRKGHHGVTLDAESWDRLTTWADLNAPFYGTWGEIPQFCQDPAGAAQLATVSRRATELRRQYVSMGPHPDYEAVPEAAPYDTTPVKPVPEPAPAAAPVATSGWPFSTAEAIRKQQETAPTGTQGQLTLPLTDCQAVTPAGRYLRVAAGPARWLSITEAQIFSGGTNIALGKPATQSSIYQNAGARLAVDGNTDGVFLHGTVTHTQNGPDEWWEVDLGAVFPIEQITLWNRTDTAGERLAAVTVTLMGEQRRAVWSARTETAPRDRYELLDRHAASLRCVWIPPGDFVMGSTEGHPDERPAHPVRIDRGFWMGRTEVTNAQFREFMTSHESRTEDRHGYQFGALGYDQDQPLQPAVRVSWNEAMAFCRWLSQKSGRKITLPSETQWEWACRAGTPTPFWWGGMAADYSPWANLGDRRLREFAADTALDNYSAARPMANPNRYDAWLPHDERFDDGGFVTVPVGHYQPNPWGLGDMHGNAWEWTHSVYQPYPQGQQDGLANPSGDHTERVARGGSWHDRPARCTASYRLAYQQFQKVYNVGFRVICED